MGPVMLLSVLVWANLSPVDVVARQYPECDMMAFGAEDASSTGEPLVTAATAENGSQPGCASFGTQTETWIDKGSNNVTIGCDTGSWSGWMCYAYSTGNSSSGAWSMGYGYFAGYSKHWSIESFDPWGWYQLGSIRNVTLWAGDAPPSGGGGGGEEECSDPSECNQSPILLPLTNKAQAFKLTSVEEGVTFDINGDGKLDQLAWTAADSELAFLAIDRNGNGIIDDGRELFGNNTLPDVPNGFAALAQLNMELNGGRRTAYINADEPLYAKLLLWEDRNHNGSSESSELQPLSRVFAAVGLGYDIHNRRDSHGNFFYLRGFAHVRTKPGKNMPVEPADQRSRGVTIYDVFFRVR